MATPNELRLFISSTFRDLQEEREHLVKKIFPEIRALCRKRGIAFTEVDLRWGLTDEDVKLGQVIRACLEEVDKCRPYFIGITGNRYGYIPSYLDIQKDPALLEQYPWIEDAAMEEMSITEMETHFALLGVGKDVADKEPADKARFYFRRHRQSFEEEIDDDDEMERLEAYQERIEESGASIEKFRDPVSLGEMIYDDLAKIIKKDFADVVPPTPLEIERSRHEAFSISRRRAYIANPVYLKNLNDHAKGDGPPLTVYAESGSGKSSLFAFWADQFRRKNPGAHVIEHYVGIGATATDHYAVIRHLCMEVKERFGREEEIPSDPKELETAFGQWLGYAEHELAKTGEKMVLILDGLNQLQGTALELHWIPEVINPSIRLIISSTIEGTLMKLRARGWSELGMQALSEPEREAVVVRYLAEYRKSLNTEQITTIASDHKCGHPLFLKTVLEEIRMVGRHEELDQHIDYYLKTTGTEDLFQRVLERMEEDHGVRAVRTILSLIGLSRSGLDERELSEISGVSRLKVTAITAGLDYHLVRKAGLLTFFHDYLRRAVEKRYLMEASVREERYRVLADYFEGGEVTLRRSLELLHALEALGSHERLHGALSDIERFVELWKSEEQEVLRLWSSVEMTEIVEAYQGGVHRWKEKERSSHEQLEVRRQVAGLYERVGAWSAAEDEQRRCLDLARESGERTVEVGTLTSLASLAHQLGRMEEAERLSRESEQIARETGDRGSIAGAVGNRGIVHADRGEYPEALDCYREQEQIAREIGNRSIIAIAVGNRGNVHFDRGEYPEALDCYREAERIVREMGDRLGLSWAVGNRGLVHADRGEYPEALDCYREQEQIAREIGNRSIIAIAVGNRGNVHFDRGEYPEALDCYREKEQAAREIGDRRSGAIAVGNRGLVHAKQSEFAEAFACFQRAAEECREIGFRFGLSYWLEGRARVLLELVVSEARTTPLSGTRQAGPMPPYLPEFVPNPDPQRWHAGTLQTAREHAEECVAISEELSKPDTLFSGHLLLTRIEAAEGDADHAIAELETMLDEATDSDRQAELHYWLWKLGAPGHLSAALALYEDIYQSTPKHEYHLRIEELKAAATSTSSET